MPIRLRTMAAPLLVLGAIVAMPSARGADYTGYATVASDSMFRGVSLVDGGLALQFGGEGRFDHGLVVGAWASRADYQWLYEGHLSGRVEANVYAGFDFACGSACRTRIVVSDYVFPGSDTNDWKEITASIGFFERFGASWSYSPHGLGSQESTRTVEAWVVQPLTRNTSIAADAGKVWLGSFPYWYTRVGASHRFGRWVVDVSHYWSDPKYVRYGFDDRRKRLVASLSTAF
jgi:uncharacterized protein (TIGR02001 family)